MDAASATAREISCRVTRTLILYVRDTNGSLGNLLDGLALDEAYLSDTNNWVSHAFLQQLYGRMIALLGDEAAVYKLALASKRYESLGLLDWIARLLGNPRLIYAQAPWFNRLLKANGDVHIHEMGDDWVLLEDRYHRGATKTRYDCDYTRGIVAGIPTIFDMPLARVEEVACQVGAAVYGTRVWPDAPPQGAGGCLYRVQWDARARPPLWKRLFQRLTVHRRAVENLLEANRLIQQKYGEARALAADLEGANRRLEASAAELRASEERYRLLAERVNDAIWVLDLATLRFTYISPAIEKIRGFTAAEAIAHTLEETLAPDALVTVTNVLQAELAREGQGEVDPGRSTTLEVRLSCRGGLYRWCEVNASFLRDAQGRPTAVLGVTRDISERKEAEQLSLAKLAAEAANAAKTAFLSHMSHELRTPLNHIMGFTELLLDKHFGPLNALQEEYLSDIHQSSEHLLRLVDEVLDVSRIEAGRMGIHPAPVVLRGLLEKSLSIIADKALEKGIRLETRIGDIPGTVAVDEVRLRQVLYNLLGNAVKFTPPGGRIVLSARTAPPGPGGTAGGIEIGVEDNGIGIPPAELERIFEPFTRLEGALSGRYPGTGLGLTLARNLVALHGGRIWGESEGPGKGAAFRFTLPLDGVPPSPAAGGTDGLATAATRTGVPGQNVETRSLP